MPVSIVLPTVDFDGEPVTQTDEIDDVIVVRRLTTEMIAAFSPRPQVNP